ncbi:MAG TPA: hypothetical protein VN758_04685 [Solirubrobacterales bacterium]|nr:hypothetical protein [Solirubrobacterales bacterium]
MFGAVAIRAALPGESTVGKFELSEPVISGAEVLATTEGTAELSVSALGIKIKCTGSDAEGKFITQQEALVSAKFTGCKVFAIPGGEELPCHILNGTEKDVIVATAKLLPILHGGELFALAEPDSPATAFTTIKYETGFGCPVPAKQEVKGSVTAQAPSVAGVKPLITFSEAIQKLTGDKLLYGINEAFASGSAIVELIGIYKGYAFSII